MPVRVRGKTTLNGKGHSISNAKVSSPVFDKLSGAATLFS